MVIKLLFFASLKDLVKCKSITVQIDNKITLMDLFDVVKTKNPSIAKLEDLLSSKDSNKNNQISLFINGKQIDFDPVMTINSDSELAFLPPVGGG